MTEKQRVVLNVAATYGRTVFSIACGLVAGRWTLMALGQVDYGLYGVVGGLTAFISFLNSLMAAAVGRFYAFSVGQSKVDGGEGVEVCRKWFNTALAIHTVIPVVLIVVGYPIAEWAVRNWLNIPPDRVAACVTVLRCICITCFVGMVNVPFAAMYGAKQYIAELTVYSIVQTAVNTVFLYYMVSHPGVWLERYALWCCFVHATPMIIIGWRAYVVFPECRFVRQYLFDVARFKQLFAFAAYRFGGAMCDLINEQGMALLVNKMLGPVRNAAMAVGNTVSGYSQTFAGSLSGAMYPAITNACGEGDLEKMRRWSFSACKFTALMSLIFVLPLTLEVREVMVLWLKDPPLESAALCICLMYRFVFEGMTSGHYMAIFSVGDIRGYQISLIVAGLLTTVPIAWAGLCMWPVLLTIGLALLFNRFVTVVIRLHYGRTIAGMGAWHWVAKVLWPFMVASFFALAAGWLVMRTMAPCLIRVCLVTVAVEIVFLPLVWLLLFTKDERQYFVAHTVNKFLKKLGVVK